MHAFMDCFIIKKCHVSAAIQQNLLSCLYAFSETN